MGGSGDFRRMTTEQVHDFIFEELERHASESVASSGSFPWAEASVKAGVLVTVGIAALVVVGGVCCLFVWRSRSTTPSRSSSEQSSDDTPPP